MQRTPCTEEVPPREYITRGAHAQSMTQAGAQDVASTAAARFL